MQKRKMYEFFSYDEEQIDKWMVQLTFVCVRLDLIKQYNRKDQIGKGNFASVSQKEM